MQKNKKEVHIYKKNTNFTTIIAKSIDNATKGDYNVIKIEGGEQND